MPIQIDITKTPFYRLGEKRGIEKGKQEGLKEGEQRGLVKGLKEGLKEAILIGIELKFGKIKAKQVKKLLGRIDDIRYLRKIKKEVIQAKSWKDFIRAFRSNNNK